MGEVVLLDMSTPQAKAWAGILGRMQLTNEAVYLEIDPSTNVVTELLIPRPVKVGRLKSCPGKEDVEVVGLSAICVIIYGDPTPTLMRLSVLSRSPIRKKLLCLSQIVGIKMRLSMYALSQLESLRLAIFLLR